MSKPEEYPFTVAISEEELVALVKYHSGQVKAVARKYGKAAMDVRLFRAIPTGAELKALHQVVKEKMEKHMSRAKGLASLIK